MILGHRYLFHVERSSGKTTSYDGFYRGEDFTAVSQVPCIVVEPADHICQRVNIPKSMLSDWEEVG